MKLRLAALAAMMVIGAAPAHAVSSSSASFTDITFQLVDLNPLDALTPYLTFINGSSAASTVSTNVSLNDPDTGSDGGSNTKTGVRSTTSKSSSQDFGATTANASVVGNNATTLNGAGTYTSALSSVSASGSAYSPTAGGYASYSATAQVPNYWYSSNFLLSANTILIVTANGAASAQNSVGYDGLTGSSENSYAQLSFNLSGSGPSGSGSQGASDSISLYNYYWYGTGAQSDARVMGGAFTNLSNVDLYGTLSLQATVSGDSSVVSLPAPVPEPESYAMMLAGLGAIGAMARRRKQK
ncbi:hypothetical protein Lcho_2339 [Leptothrix cholodnii SP-6]|uniref:Ice-binding protein C-terminal domain-containing protein n=1 Tax=Leptothrix cholodnii (strain ATCC 51168 / LMG 8142 / SP-6) TaxID=395495 RepID=B1Y482_LEPCP|nr:PEP-CTERM sorting domain-containing protein [Leptothrix cholodnii]ACB34604.1 hypothetical protein Lcho_2339 [Leptothrix cholodnii SP-6]